MVTGTDLFRYQTKYRPKEYQKLPSKKQLVAINDELYTDYYTLFFHTYTLPYVLSFRNELIYWLKLFYQRQQSSKKMAF